MIRPDTRSHYPPMSISILPLLVLALIVPQRSPSDSGLRSEERAIAVRVTVLDPASAGPQIGVTPGGITTLSYFFLRNRAFVIRDTNDTWVEASVLLAPSGHRYRSRDGAGVGTTDVTYVVRVRYWRRVYIVVSGEIVSTDASVWEAERFGVSPANDSGRTRVHDDLSACLARFADSFDETNRTIGP